MFQLQATNGIIIKSKIELLHIYTQLPKASEHDQAV